MEWYESLNPNGQKNGWFDFEFAWFNLIRELEINNRPRLGRIFVSISLRLST
jgi:hypothetical protein